MSRTQLIRKVPEKTTDNKKYVDYLEQDPPVAGQSYVLLSFVSPTGNQKCDISGLKVRGVASDYTEAQQRVKSLLRMDDSFDIFIAPLGVWLPWSPDPEKIQDQEYANDQLNELMKGYRENKMQTADHFSQRKRDLMEEAIREGSKEGQEKLANRKEHPIAVKHRIIDYETDLKELREKLENLENKYNEYTEKYKNDYTAEEIKEAEVEFEKLQDRMRNVSTQEELSEIHQELRKKYDEYEEDNSSLELDAKENSSEEVDLPEINPDTFEPEEDAGPIKISEIPPGPTQSDSGLTGLDPWTKVQMQKKNKPV